ncbi:Heat shock factor-binding protein 1 [Trichinella pseudospiralis]|uniref:Heat shock factor-binding protein 1 n=1 Tax=Trichinella pseudospiralis TaxID=6337 RepID=A0A0V0Y898_TRIPS|nr:Heat shock factor-binding protein 1 [Trichinella pseudospiralis]
MNENNSNKSLAAEDLDAHPDESDHQNEQLDERFHGESDEKTKEAMEFNSALELDDNVWNNLSNLFNEMQDRFCTIGALDDMGTRLDDLEKLINNLITQSIIEEQTEKSQAF